MLRRCFFAYSFPYFAWIFALYPVLPKTQKELLRKFRNGLRLVHRCPFARAPDLLQITREESLAEYVKIYIKKRLEKIEKSDLGRSSFYNDIFYWDAFHKKKNDHLGHFFQRKRIKLMCERHQCLLIQWLEFISKWGIPHYRLTVLFLSFGLHNTDFAVCLLLLFHSSFIFHFSFFLGHLLSFLHVYPNVALCKLMRCLVFISLVMVFNEQL